MEEVLQGVSAVIFVLLAVIGLLAGWFASVVAGGRHRGRYMAIGLIAALAMPFVAAAVGLTALAAWGVLAIIFVSLIGAVIVLVIAKLIFD